MCLTRYLSKTSLPKHKANKSYLEIPKSARLPGDTISVTLDQSSFGSEIVNNVLYNNHPIKTSFISFDSKQN